MYADMLSVIYQQNDIASCTYTQAYDCDEWGYEYESSCLVTLTATNGTSLDVPCAQVVAMIEEYVGDNDDDYEECEY